MQCLYAEVLITSLCMDRLLILKLEKQLINAACLICINCVSVYQKPFLCIKTPFGSFETFDPTFDRRHETLLTFWRSNKTPYNESYFCGSARRYFCPFMGIYL